MQNFFPVVLNRVHNECGRLHEILWHMEADPRAAKVKKSGQLFFSVLGGGRLRIVKKKKKIFFLT